MTPAEVFKVIPRVFHHISIHTQEEHRFSYTDPPLAQLPEDLEDLYLPDPGWPWLAWDYNQLEDYIIGHESQDKQYLLELDEGWDGHTVFTVELFDLPPCPDYCDPHFGEQTAAWRKEVKWKGKGDKRRKLGKNGRHALKYGKDPRLMHLMPGYRAAGIKKDMAIRGATRFLARYPRMLEWRASVAQEALKTGIVRDFRGRRWVIFERNIEAIKRRAYNGPGQIGASSIHNKVMDDINQEFGEQVSFKWGKHDSNRWAIIQQWWNEIVPRMKAIVEQEWDFRGRKVVFPATFKEVWA